MTEFAQPLEEATAKRGIAQMIVARDDHKGLPRWVEQMFAVMQRNSAHVSDYLRLPRDQVVEIGREIAI